MAIARKIAGVPSQASLAMLRPAIVLDVVVKAIVAVDEALKMTDFVE
jgi:hypothetical protein